MFACCLVKLFRGEQQMQNAALYFSLPCDSSADVWHQIFKVSSVSNTVFQIQESVSMTQTTATAYIDTALLVFVYAFGLVKCAT